MTDDDHETHDEYLDRQEEHELDAADARVADLLDRALVAEDRAMRIQETLGDARVDLLVVTAERDEARAELVRAERDSDTQAIRAFNEVIELLEATVRERDQARSEIVVLSAWCSSASARTAACQADLAAARRFAEKAAAEVRALKALVRDRAEVGEIMDGVPDPDPGAHPWVHDEGCDDD